MIAAMGSGVSVARANDEYLEAMRLRLDEMPGERAELKDALRDWQEAAASFQAACDTRVDPGAYADRLAWCQARQSELASKRTELLSWGKALRRVKAVLLRAISAPNANKALAALTTNGEGMWILPGRITGEVQFYFQDNPVGRQSIMLVDKVVTRSGGSITLNFHGNHSLRLGPNSEMALDAQAFEAGKPLTKIVIQKIVGVSRFAISALPKRREPFRIETEWGCICVRGTDFVLRTDRQGRMEVGLIEGNIDYIPATGGDPISLASGRWFVVGENGEAIQAPMLSGEIPGDSENAPGSS